MDNGLNFLFDAVDVSPLVVTHRLPFNPLKDPDLYEKALRNNEGIQFSHTLEEQIGGQLQAGFMLTDLYEDRDRTGILQEYAPQYIAARSVKPF
ncbi:MAG: hypothetical protein LBD55_08490 [Treponema sp.]|jgi:hypothetical protein|nr:hypothetical protein [Treponema sp.]